VAQDEGRRLWRLVARLPLGERTALVLHYRQELSVNEVAAALGVTTGTVKTLLFRARRHLRAALAEAPPDTRSAG
jgi:RNA polymerase sigma-70 factor (ECF subfamily)